MTASRTRAAVTAGGLAALLATGTLTMVLTRQSGAGPQGDRIADAAFTSFTDCPALLGYYRNHGRDLVGPYGLPGSSASDLPLTPGAVPRVGAAPGARVVPDSLAGSATGSGSGPVNQSGTGTNVQVPGVDEADVAKRSGDLLLTVAAPSRLRLPLEHGAGTKPPDRTGPALRILRIGGTRAITLGTLPIDTWSATQLLVRGSTVLLIGESRYPAPAGSDTGSLPRGYRLGTRITQVDITDPAHPRPVRTLDVAGSVIGARLVGDTARVALTSAPRELPLVAPVPSPVPGTDAPRATAGPPSPPTPTTEAESLAANRRLIAASTLDDWLPRYTLTEVARGSGPSTPDTARPAPGPSTPGPSTPGRSSGPLLDCAKVAAPARFSGLDTLSLLTFDLTRAEGIGAWKGAGVVATGTTLYATAEHTYVATSPWQDWAAMSGERRQRAEQDQRTWIHEFVTGGSGEPRYLASGSVPGFLLNQYALDEYRGDLRVASTATPSPQVDAGADNSHVTVLRAVGNRLAPVGSVGGIGRGEQIRGVRFIGPVGYVVTFRQTDPLFTVDLSDPASPRVAGELTLLGYSAYLHPAGNGLLLGVGQDADGAGRRTGLHLSLFDVSHPAAPHRVAQVVLPDAVTAVESDAHAFTLADGLVLVPYTRHGTSATRPPTPAGPPSPEGMAVMPPDMAFDTGVVAVRIRGQELSAPTILHPQGVSGTLTGGNPYAGVDLTPLRTFTHGGAIWMVTAGGVAAHQESTLRWLSFARFPR